MATRPSISRTRAVLLTIALALLILALSLGPAWLLAGNAGSVSHEKAMGTACGMSEECMRKMTAEWFAAHPVTGIRSLAPTAAVVKVSNFLFNADNNASTTFDTVKIAVGETVQWQWISGIHTVTSGTGSGDPEAGADFNFPIDSANNSNSVLFTSAGVFPYFCSFHELQMRGWVKVGSTSGVEPLPLPDGHPGFVSSPTPNPTRAGVIFRFALKESGPVRIDVFDVKGRLVAVPVDRDLTAGAYDAAWDGRESDGGAVPAGVYYLHLTAAGIHESRNIIVAR